MRERWCSRLLSALLTACLLWSAQTQRTVALLLDAASMTLRGVGAAAFSNREDPDPARTATILAVWSAVAGEDIAAEIERLRKAGE